MAFCPIKAAPINKIQKGKVMKILKVSKTTPAISIIPPMSKREIKDLKNKQMETKINISKGILRLKAKDNNKAAASKSPTPKIFTINILVIVFL